MFDNICQFLWTHCIAGFYLQQSIYHHTKAFGYTNDNNNNYLKQNTDSQLNTTKTTPGNQIHKHGLVVTMRVFETPPDSH